MTIEEPKRTDNLTLYSKKEHLYNQSISSEVASTTPSIEEKWKPKLSSAFARTLSSIPSYEQMKKDHKVADYHLKIVVVGDGNVGKTCLLISYVNNEFPTDYIPTVFENYVTSVNMPNREVIELALWDTAGQEEYNRLRPLSYTDVDVLMVCYSVDNKTSLEHVEELWFPEVRHFCGKTPVMLIGLKSDLYAEDKGEGLVETKHAELIAKKMGAFVHLQCSAKSRDNVEEVFNKAIEIVLGDSRGDGKASNSVLKNPFKKNVSKRRSNLATSYDIKVDKPVRAKNERFKGSRCIIT
ncbi:Rho family GTPase RHO4 NDAI_0B05400 [Naumovozyma dairenensis CBS 421]|uniref:GTP-binding protein RHO4 n=1 Tax=Naumovozyma dairenensis (strain ATCC 10597 / BCRC 20456 / CBS 421 / NBRC 0211 / NRRL Y-12639) TaxID=1071378 RepID=G0W712_NAUDC|nr:hypothetical protein NDAI_0B05400 [Naumovozyma dairenensis CBS 421]CCD23573.1 hypothetical protein NDAI_0B05400 [Naumovozyma dairenensis CBS 421]